MLVDEDFLDALGELIDDLRDTFGDIDFLLNELDFLKTDAGVSSGGSKTISATRGDSVSLNAKSSVSVCFDALITSTHFSVQTPTSLYLKGSSGSSIILQSPTPTVFISDILSVAEIPQDTSIVFTSDGRLV